MNSLSTVCMLLGPYRNFTTLTASVLALHPLVSVLNHGGERVFANPDIDFTDGYTSEKFDAFCDFALEAQKGGRKGSYGGSITLSGAFHKNHKIKDQYSELYGNGKPGAAKCLFWKEPHRLLYHLRENNFDFETVFDRNPKLRFLIPVRNIYECACSNFITGHFTISYSGVRNDPAYIDGSMAEREQSIASSHARSKILQVIEVLLMELKYLDDLHQRFPDRFLFYFQHEPPKQILANILKFLKLEDDRQALYKMFEIRPNKYGLDMNMRNDLLTRIDEYFPPNTVMRRNLRQFFEGTNSIVA